MANDVSAQITAMTAATQKASIGADIITGTLDALNSPMYGGKAGKHDDLSKMTPATQKAAIGTDIITGTLDTLNSPMYSNKAGKHDDLSDSYNFQKDVLSAVYEGKGAIANTKF